MAKAQALAFEVLAILPIIGAAFGVSVPIHPGYLLAMVPRGRREQIESLRADGDVMTALSVGLDVVRRVVIPASQYGVASEDALRHLILHGRSMCKTLCQGFLDGNRTI